MFNPFRKLGRFLRSRSRSPAKESTTKPEAVEETQPAPSTPAPKAPNTTTGKLPASASTSPPASASESSTSQKYSNPATAGEDYRAAFNYALPPRTYARPALPPFKPSFGIPAKQTKSTFDAATFPERHLNDIPPPSVPLWSPNDECDDEDMNENPEPYVFDSPVPDYGDLCASEMGSVPSSPSMTPADEGDMPEPEAWSAEDNEGDDTAQTDEEMSQADPASTTSPQEGSASESEDEYHDTAETQADDQVPQSDPAPMTPPQEGSTSESQNEGHDTTQADEQVPQADPASTTSQQQCSTPEFQNGSTESSSHDGATTPDTETSSTPPAPTPTTQNNRPTLSPRHPRPKYKKNWVDEIIQEVNDPSSPLPGNYTGTFRGVRYYKEDWTSGFECGYQNHHRLLCGHYVASREPCGRNCKDAILETAPFQCPTCRDLINDLLDNKISTEEQEQLKKLYVIDKALVTMRCIELATRGLPQIKAGIADTVAAGILEGYARKAPTSNGPPVVDSVPLRVIIAERQVMWEKRQKRRMEEDMAAAAEAQMAEKKKRGMSGDEEHDEEAATKFQKTKLQGFPEPITQDTKGTKRTSGDEESDEEAPTKFQKVKFQGFPEPITKDTRGSKRTSADDEEKAAGTKKQKVKLSASPEPITEETRGRKRTSSRHPLPSSQSGKKLKTGNASSAPCMALVKGVKRSYEAEEASEETAGRVKRGRV